MGTSVSTPNGHCCCYHIQDDHATQFLTKVLTTKSYEIPDTKSYLFDEFFIRGKTSGKHTLEVCDDFGRGKLQQQKKSLSHDQMEEIQQGVCAICEAGCHGLSGSHVRCDVAICYCMTACCFLRLLAAASLKLNLNDNRLLVNEPVCECHQHDVLDYIQK